MEDRWDIAFLWLLMAKYGKLRNETVKKETNWFFERAYTQKREDLLERQSKLKTLSIVVREFVLKVNILVQPSINTKDEVMERFVYVAQLCE